MKDELIVGSVGKDESKAPDTTPEDVSLVSITIHYPESYKGVKLMFEGKEYRVSPETALILREKGIVKSDDKKSSADDKKSAEDNKQISKPIKSKKK